MRFLPFVVAAFGTTILPAYAQGTRTISSADNAEPVTKTLPVATITYSDLKKSYKINPHVSLSDVKTDVQSHIGRALEITGAVSGILATPDGKTVIITTAEGIAVLNTHESAMGMDLLRAGKGVRVLALVGTGDNGTPAFTLVAATDNAATESLFRSPYDNDITIVPPSSDVILPKPKQTPYRQPRITKAPPGKAPLIKAPATSYGITGETSFEQKPAYKNLVRRFNKKLSEAQVDEIAAAILRAGEESRLDPRFLAAIIAVESDFDIYCLSSSGAMGLGQLMPFNLKEAGITNAWNPTQNVIGTARLLRGHLDDYKNRADGTLLAVAAYNAGPGAVRRAGYKVPNGRQVQRYVWKVYYRYKEFAPDLFANR